MDMQANPQAERDSCLELSQKQKLVNLGSFNLKVVGICVAKTLQDQLAGILQNTYLDLGI